MPKLTQVDRENTKDSRRLKIWAWPILSLSTVSGNLLELSTVFDRIYLIAIGRIDVDCGRPLLQQSLGVIV